VGVIAKRSKTAAAEGLAGTQLAVVLGGFEPAAEDGEGLRLDFQERETTTEVRLDVNDFCLGVEEIFAGENFHEHESAFRERIHHVEVAAVKAQLADASGDAHVGFLLDELGAGDEGVAGRAALFSFQEDGPLNYSPMKLGAACRGVAEGLLLGRGTPLPPFFHKCSF
jgi:hypothetical protein